jgi:hypothetical protein
LGVLPLWAMVPRAGSWESPYGAMYYMRWESCLCFSEAAPRCGRAGRGALVARAGRGPLIAHRLLKIGIGIGIGIRFGF